MFGGRAEKQQRHPLALGVHRHIVQLLAHRFEAAQVVLLLEQPLKTWAVPGLGNQNYSDFSQQSLLGYCGREPRFFTQARHFKKFGGESPAKST
jgi:hypothetical protein